MKFIVNGASGRMGTVLCELIEANENHELVAKVAFDLQSDAANHIYKTFDEVDVDAQCVIDFSNHLGTSALIEYCCNKNIAVVIATTGQTEEEMQLIQDSSKKIPVFYSANMSLGVALVACLAKIAAKTFGDADIEIIEKHHNQKLDSPSGTALLLADAIKTVKPQATYNLGRSGYGKREKNEIGIHAVRMGNVVGDHEIIFNMGTQAITIKHEAGSRNLFAEGAVRAAEFLATQDVGIYCMDDILD